MKLELRMDGKPFVFILADKEKSFKYVNVRSKRIDEYVVWALTYIQKVTSWTTNNITNILDDMRAITNKNGE